MSESKPFRISGANFGQYITRIKPREQLLLDKVKYLKVMFTDEYHPYFNGRKVNINVNGVHYDTTVELFQWL